MIFQFLPIPTEFPFHVKSPSQERIFIVNSARKERHLYIGGLCFITHTFLRKEGKSLGERNNARHNFGSSTLRKTKSTLGGQYHKLDWFEGRSLAVVRWRKIVRKPSDRGRLKDKTEHRPVGSGGCVGCVHRQLSKM